MSQVTLLKVGRHFVSSDGQRILVPRDDLENRRLWNLRRHVNVVLEAEGVGGPQGAVMTQQDVTETTLREAAALVARYGQARGADTVDVTVTSSDGSWTRDPHRLTGLGRRARRASQAALALPPGAARAASPAL